jgi:hypothetical protein
MKAKIQSLENEIKSIDKILFVLMLLTLVESILVFFSYTELNIFSLLFIVATIILFRVNLKKRNNKDTLMRVYEAMDDEEAFDKKYLKL